MKIAYALYRPFEQAILKRAAAIITTSPPYRDSSSPLRPWLHKCRVVPLGLDAHRLLQYTTELETSDRCENTLADENARHLRVLAVGRLTYYKGFQYLIGAAARTANISVDLVGMGDQAQELKQQAAALGLQDRVTFQGLKDDRELAELMSRCDCLCLPSIERTEAFGMVLLEAMSFGKATVVSDVPGSGMGWIVDHGVTGLKVPPADSSALAEAFRALMADREWLVEMGRAGREKFERMFEINHAVEGIIDTYQAVIADQGRAAVGIRSSD